MSLTWTDEKPTREGWYFYRHNNPDIRRARGDSRCSCGFLEMSSFAGYMMFCDGRIPRSIDAWDGLEWAGPIPEPEEENNRG